MGHIETCNASSTPMGAKTCKCGMVLARSEMTNDTITLTCPLCKSRTKIHATDIEFEPGEGLSLPAGEQDPCQRLTFLMSRQLLHDITKGTGSYIIGILFEGGDGFLTDSGGRVLDVLGLAAWIQQEAKEEHAQGTMLKGIADRLREGGLPIPRSPEEQD